MISIIIPIIRPELAKQCIASIRRNMDGLVYEIITEEDTGRIGCPKMIKRLVAKTKFNLVLFLGDDTIPNPNFAINALKAMKQLPDGWGLVGLNDGHYRQDECATHWLADKRLLPLLNGEFFHIGYKHTFCDNELTLRCKRMGRYIWAKDACILHNHPIFKKEKLTDDYHRVYSKDYIEHDKQLFLSRNLTRTDIINDLIERNSYKRYLEIGIGNPKDNYDRIKCANKAGVDPNVECFFKMTSDRFFEIYIGPPSLAKYDLIFIDGLHIAVQVLRDIKNSLQIITESGMVVVHDCNPTSEYLQRPIEQFDGTGDWCGDVWKAFAKLRATRTDLGMYVIDADYGLGVIHKGSQEVFKKRIIYDYKFFDENRVELLKLKAPKILPKKGTEQDKVVVLVGTPLAKDMKIDVRTLMYLQQEIGGKDWKWTVRAGYGAEHSRNEMIAEMLEGNYTHIYFVDADTIPTSGTIDKLLGHDKDIVAGITPVWNTERRWSYQIEEDVPIPACKPPTEIFKAARTGGTTILIKREVFEKLEWPYFKTEKCGDEYKTDDFYFCDKARAAGFDIWIDPTIVCGHLNYVNLLDMFFKEFEPK